MSNVRPEVRAGMGLFFMKVGQQPQRQDSLEDQLRDLRRVAARLGMYDAADWLWKHTSVTDEKLGRESQG